MLYARGNPFSAVRIVAQTVSRYVRNIVRTPLYVSSGRFSSPSIEKSPLPNHTLSTAKPTLPPYRIAFIPPFQEPCTDPIVRPPSPPGGKKSHSEGPRRAYRLFTEASNFNYAAACATYAPRCGVHTAGAEQLHLAYTKHQHIRHMSMPAVASQPDTLNWFKRRESPSIFELFEKAIPTTRRTFRFAHAASAMPKRASRPCSNDSGEFLSVQVGEDAYFVRPDSLGVADGVGGWAQVKGANPALYSRKIMHYASAELEKLDDIVNSDYTIEDYNNVDPRDILQKSYDHTNLDAKAENLLGSTTAIIAILRDDELRIANLGDCGVLIIRDSEPIFRTEEQQHSFNFPFQLGTGSRDSPADAQTFRVKVEEGDIVILGSDGMFDNVFDEDIVDIVRSVTQNKKAVSVDPQRITDALLKRAREIAEDSRFSSSPFQSRAIQEGLYYQGGKMDDVTVLAGVVRLSEDSPDRR